MEKGFIGDINLYLTKSVILPRNTSILHQCIPQDYLAHLVHLHLS